MSYFKSFKPTLYRFGNETGFSIATDITNYVDMVDQVKSTSMMIDDYTIPANERPDQTSFKIYGTTDYYWTFFLANDHIRERGWPLTLHEVDTAAELRYPHRMVTCQMQHQDVIDYYDADNKPITRTKLIGTAPDNFPVGTVVTGNVSGTVGIIIKRDLSHGTFIVDTLNASVQSEVSEQSVQPNSNGVLILERTDLAEAETFVRPLQWVLKRDGETLTNIDIDIDSFGRTVTISAIGFSPNSTYTLSYVIQTANITDGKFRVGEDLVYPNPAGGTTSMIIYAESSQLKGVHHYENASGEWVDINPLSQDLGGAIAISYLENLRQANENLRQIKVIAPNQVVGIASDFNKAMIDQT
jgi:hypothetical protein